MARSWTLEAAREMLGEVRERTARAVAAVERLERAAAGDASRRAAAAQELRREVSRWMREMEALGVEVRGPWRVEFDTGAGSFCWAWPEQRLERFRAEGSEGSTPIQ
jgi:hypothetical protein